MFDVSVIICSHNPRADLLSQVLQSIREQTLPISQWELLVIDNASTEPLEKVYDLSWHPKGRHIAEPTIGISVARCRAILEARGEILVFVDDDNILDPNYLSNAIAIGRKHPTLGVWGSSQIVPRYDSEPPEHLRPFMVYLAIRDAHVAKWTNILPCNDATPWGAGLVIRSDVATAYREMYFTSRIKLSAREGTILLAGEDIEMAYVACGMGYGIGTFPDLKLVHVIPKWRLEENYLLGIVEGSKVSDILIEHKWRKSFSKERFAPRGKESGLQRFILNLKLRLKLILLERRARKRATRMISELEGQP